MGKKSFLSKEIGYWTGVISVGITIGLVLQFASAWTEPGENPPGGNVWAPINTSASNQVKLGAIIAGAFATDTSVTSPEYCIQGFGPGKGCITEWPGGGGSLWTADGNNIYNNNLTGNVGIGKINPTEKLDVAGNIHMDDHMAIKWGGGSTMIYGENPNNLLYFYTGSILRMIINYAGNVGINTNDPTEKLDINSNNIRIRTAKTPGSSTATCDQGEISWDADYVYVCVSANQWKRSTLTTW